MLNKVPALVLIITRPFGYGFVLLIFGNYKEFTAAVHEISPDFNISLTPRAVNNYKAEEINGDEKVAIQRKKWCPRDDSNVRHTD